jgi:hypothetical protein
LDIPALNLKLMLRKGDHNLTLILDIYVYLTH